MGTKKPFTWTDEDFHNVIEDKVKFPLAPPDLVTRRELMGREERSYWSGFLFGVASSVIVVVLHLLRVHFTKE